jgi:hypothetical protein
MARMAIEAQFKRIGDQISKMIVDSGALGKVWGTIFGTGTSAAGGAVKSGVGAASSAGGAAASAGSGISSVAGNMATAWIGAISSAVSAVSGVISNFQFMAMNKSLDLIEHETRFAQIHLLNILEKLNVFLPATKDIWSYLWTAQYPLLLKATTALESGGTKGNVTINVNGAGDPRAVAQEVAKALRLQVPSMAYV